MPSLGPMEMMIVGAIAILLFGNRLPSVMRSLGKGVVEFKKGLKDIQDEVHNATREEPRSTPRVTQAHDYDEPTAPKFEPPKAEPQTVPDDQASA